jgi:hypothetical protein
MEANYLVMVTAVLTIATIYFWVVRRPKQQLGTR